MTVSSDFQPGEKLPTLGITDPNVSSWARWVLPIGTGLIAASLFIYLI